MMNNRSTSQIEVIQVVAKEVGAFKGEVNGVFTDALREVPFPLSPSFFLIIFKFSYLNCFQAFLRLKGGEELQNFVVDIEAIQFLLNQIDLVPFLPFFISLTFFIFSSYIFLRIKSYTLSLARFAVGASRAEGGRGLPQAHHHPSDPNPAQSPLPRDRYRTSLVEFLCLLSIFHQFSVIYIVFFF